MPASALVPRPMSKVESLPLWLVAHGSLPFARATFLIASVVSITRQA